MFITKITFSVVLLVVVVFMFILLKIFIRGSKKTPKMEEDKKILKYPKIFEIIGWVSFAGAVIFTIGAFFNTKSSISIPEILILFFVFIICPFFLILARRNSYLAYDDEKIEYQGILGRKKIFFWGEIKKVRLIGGGSLLICAKNQKIWLSYAIIGFKDFLENIKQKTNPTVMGKTMEKADMIFLFDSKGGLKEMFKRYKIKSIIYILILITFGFVGYYLAARDNVSQKTDHVEKSDYINEGVKMAKEKIKLPFKINESITLIDIAPESGAIRYDYNVSSTIDTSQLSENTIKNNLIINACGNQELKNILNKKIDLKYSYNVEGSGQKYLVSLSESDCQK